MTVFTCANTRCGVVLDIDHVVLVTTVHMRRFCSVECITQGQEAHHAATRGELDCDTWR